MVYYTDTYELCHEVTKLGRENYQKLLVDAADEILFKHKHPIKWVIKQIFPKLFKNTEKSESDI